VTALRREAQGLTSSAIHRAQVMQPGWLTREEQNQHLAHCFHGMAFTGWRSRGAIAFTVAVHRTSFASTGSLDSAGLF
jgi:hypothetical protein